MQCCVAVLNTGCASDRGLALWLQRTMETKRYNLESAEGCYSMALMYSRDIKAKYAVKVRCYPSRSHLVHGYLGRLVLPG